MFLGNPSIKIQCLLSPEGPRGEDPNKLSRPTKRQYFHNSSEVASCNSNARYCRKTKKKEKKNRREREGEKGWILKNCAREPLRVSLPPPMLASISLVFRAKRCCTSCIQLRAIQFDEFPKSRIPHTRFSVCVREEWLPALLNRSRERREKSRPWHSDTLCRNVGARGRCRGSSLARWIGEIRPRAVSFPVSVCFVRIDVCSSLPLIRWVDRLFRLISCMFWVLVTVVLGELLNDTLMYDWGMELDIDCIRSWRYRMKNIACMYANLWVYWFFYIHNRYYTHENIWVYRVRFREFSHPIDKLQVY